MSAAVVMEDVDEVHAEVATARRRRLPEGGGPLLELLRRYEAVVATVAIIVVITRVTGGGFLNDRIGPEPQAATVTPFTSSEPAGEISAAEPGVVTGFDSPMPSLATTPTASVAVGQVAIPSAAPVAAPSADFAAIPEPGSPAAVAVTPTGRVWVGTDNAGGPPVLFELDPGGALSDRHTVTGVQQGITAVVAGTGGAVFVAARTPAAVFRFDPASGASTPYATLPDVRPCLPPVVATDCDGALIDARPVPTAMAFGSDGSLYVADAGQAAIWRVPPGGGEVEQWLVEVGWVHPGRPSGPSALAVDGAGNLVVALRSMLAEDVGAVFVVPTGEKGAAGEPKELARTGAGSQPAGLALGTSGRLYVSLAGPGVVVVLATDGTEVGRLPSGDGGALVGPAGLAFRVDELLVAVRGADASSGKVARFAADEPGGPIHDGRRSD